MDRQKADLILLLEELTRRLVSEYDQALLDQFSISYSEWRLLLAIYLSQEEPTQENVAINAGKSAAAVSRQLKQLEDKELVERRYDKNSKRVKLVKLSRKGKRVFSNALIPISKHSKYFFSYLEEDIVPFKECLITLLDALDHEQQKTNKQD